MHAQAKKFCAHTSGPTTATPPQTVSALKFAGKVCVMMECCSTFVPAMPDRLLPAPPARDHGPTAEYVPAEDRVARLVRLTKEGTHLPMGAVHLAATAVRRVQERALYASPFHGEMFERENKGRAHRPSPHDVWCTFALTRTRINTARTHTHTKKAAHTPASLATIPLPLPPKKK